MSTGRVMDGVVDGFEDGRLAAWLDDMSIDDRKGCSAITDIRDAEVLLLR